MYADPATQLRTGYVANALKRDLPRKVQGQETELITANRYDFAQSICSFNPSAIIVPENLGPISYHMRDIPNDAIKTQNNYVHNGGTAIYFGGMAHYAMENIEWFWDEGEVHYKGPKETFSQVKGTLTGPHHRNRLSLNDPIMHQGCFEVPISVTQVNGGYVREKCWQGNCGAFDIQEDKYEVLAYYDEVDAKHIAAVEIPCGNNGGSYILCSVMPHYNPRCQSALWDKILRKIENKKVVFDSEPVLKRSP